MVKGRKRTSVRERARNTRDVASWVGASQKRYSIAPTEQPAVAPTEKHVLIKAASTDTISSVSTTHSTHSVLSEHPENKDTCYGYFVVFCSFCLHFIADGFTFSFGLVFHDMMEEFDSSRLAAGFTAALFLACPLALAPFAATCTDVLGVKKTLSIGGVLGLLGGVLSCFAPNLWVFTITFGLINGMGLSFIYNVAIVMLNLHFDVWLSSSTALAVSGTGIGTMSFPWILSEASKHSGFSKTTSTNLVWIVCMLIVCLIAFILKEVEWNSDRPEYKAEWVAQKAKFEAVDTAMSARELRRCYSLPHRINVGEAHKINFASSLLSIAEAANVSKEPAPPRSKSVVTFLPKFDLLETIPEYSMIQQEDLCHLDHLDLQLTSSPCNTVRSKNNLRRRMLSKTSMSVDAINEIDDDTEVRLYLGDTDSSSESESETESDSEVSQDGVSSDSELSDKELEKEPNFKEDKKSAVNTPQIKINGNAVPACKPTPAPQSQPRVSLVPNFTNVTRVPAQNALRHRGRYHSNCLAMQFKAPSVPDLKFEKKSLKFFQTNYFNQAAILLFSNFKKDTKVMRKVCLKDNRYILLIASMSILYSVLDVPYVFFYDHAVENMKIDESIAKEIPFYIGLSNLVSTFLIGFIGEIRLVKKYVFYFYSFCMLMASGAIITAGFVTTFTGMAIVCVWFGGSISANYVMTNVLLSMIYPESHFSPSYGLLSGIQGLTTTLGPPAIGFLRDLTGDYRAVFVMSGLLVFVSSILAFSIQRLQNKHLLKKENSRKRPSNKKNGSESRYLLNAENKV